MTDNNNNKINPTKDREIPTGSEDALEPSSHKENQSRRKKKKLVLGLLVAASLIGIVALVCSVTLRASAGSTTNTNTSLAAISPNEEAIEGDHESDRSELSTAASISDSESLGKSPVENSFENDSSLGGLDKEGETALDEAAAEEENNNTFAYSTGDYSVDNDAIENFLNYEGVPECNGPNCVYFGNGPVENSPGSNPSSLDDPGEEGEEAQEEGEEEVQDGEEEAAAATENNNSFYSIGSYHVDNDAIENSLNYEGVPECVGPNCSFFEP